MPITTNQVIPDLTAVGPPPFAVPGLNPYPFIGGNEPQAWEIPVWGAVIVGFPDLPKTGYPWKANRLVLSSTSGYVCQAVIYGNYQPTMDPRLSDVRALSFSSNLDFIELGTIIPAGEQIVCIFINVWPDVDGNPPICQAFLEYDILGLQ